MVWETLALFRACCSRLSGCPPPTLGDLNSLDSIGFFFHGHSLLPPVFIRVLPHNFSNAAVVYGYAVNTLENRLKAKVCELCGTTESDHYEVHHINKLKNLKGKERWEIAMIAKHRKTLVVCRDCHRSIIHKK